MKKLLVVEDGKLTRPAKPSVDYVGVGVGGVIINNKNEVLLQKRGKKAKNEIGKWKLPGGQIEYGETAEVALIRELKEELNVEAKIVKQLFCFDDILVDEKQHWLVPFYLCKIKKGEPKNMEPEKIAEFRWFPINHLPGNLALGTKEALNYAIKSI